MATGVRIVATAFGHAAVVWRGGAIVGLRLPAATADEAAGAAARRWPDAEAVAPPQRIERAIEDVVRYFAGDPVDFADVAVDLGEQPAFHARVYAHVRALGRGETTSYGAVARALGAERAAAQAVGRAMATNPVPLIVPCHRVLAAGGAAGGFSAPGGATTKMRMLALEGATAAAQRTFAF